MVESFQVFRDEFLQIVFVGADVCFRGHTVGLKDFFKSFRPIGWSSKFERNLSGSLGWVSSKCVRGADGCFWAHGWG